MDQCVRLHCGAVPLPHLTRYSKKQLERKNRILGSFGSSRNAPACFSVSGSSLGESTDRSSPPPRPLQPSLKVKGSILSSQIVEHDGTIIVEGDVTSGAVIHADGDIIIMGQLKGEAHAGRNGDINATIFAVNMIPMSISIAGYTFSRLKADRDCLCGIALVRDGQIRIDQIIDPRLVHPCRHIEGGSMNNAQDVDCVEKSWLSMVICSMKTMGKPSKVAMFTGMYIFIFGLALFLFPESLFGILFDVKSVLLLWIRVGAVLAMAFGVYYIGTALGDSMGYNGARSFYMSTVIGRMGIFLSFSWLVAVGAAPLTLFFLGVVNLIGAVTMFNALRSGTKSSQT